MPFFGKPLRNLEEDLAKFKAAGGACCKNCRYALKPSIFTCHRNPPTGEGWPTVNSKDWCGEFEIDWSLFR
jgi:hypothetical protein